MHTQNEILTIQRADITGELGIVSFPLKQLACSLELNTNCTQTLYGRAQLTGNKERAVRSDTNKKSAVI